MPTSWDLRRILGVNPEQELNCVGFASSKGRRCKNRINKVDRPAASRVLNQMDRAEYLTDAIDDLRELASLLLCKGVHNNLSRPGDSQVDKVYNKWKELVEEEGLRLQEHEERDAERRRRRLRNELVEIRSIATEVRASLEEEQLDTGRTMPEPSRTTISENANIDDPFQESSPSRPNIFTNASLINSNEDEDVAPDNLSSALNDELSIREGRRQELVVSDLPYMPSPPTHEPCSPVTAPRIAIAEQQETGSNSSRTPELSTLSSFEFVFGPESMNPLPSFQFETPTKMRNTQVANLLTSDSTSSVACSASNFGTSTLSTSQIPGDAADEEAERIPLKEKEARPMNVVLSNRSRTCTYEFGSGHERQFEFEAPITPRKLSLPNDSATYPCLVFQLTPLEENGSTTPSTSTQLSERPEQPDLSHSVPLNEAQPNNVLARSATPPRNNEDLFGYANVTPNSTRYTTYLPARQQYGLITPPESPEMLMGALNKPTSNPSYFGVDRLRESGSPVPRIKKKALPGSPPPKIEHDGEGGAETCPGCGRREGQGVYGCDCAETYKEELVIRSGCLARFGFRKLKEKAKGMLKVERENNRRREKNEAPDRNNLISSE